MVLREIANHKKSKNKNGSGSGASLEDIQQALKDVLGKAQAATTHHSMTGDSPAPAAAPLMEEIQLLRKALSDKDAEMESLRASSGANAAAGSSVSSVDAKALEAQIAELRAKLGEYDIISEDIADLSKFKNENTQLRNELSQLKGQSPALAAVAPAEVVAAAPTPIIAEGEAPPAEPLATPAVPPASPEVVTATQPTEKVS